LPYYEQYKKKTNEKKLKRSLIIVNHLPGVRRALPQTSPKA